jgi:dipeptidyl aminopeptidase/acylaminoacyl peptidase
VLAGTLVLPAHARAAVLFAHGSGSSRFSPRNQAVARTLRTVGFATLLIDLLGADEEREDARAGHLRFDIGLLADRLTAIADWLAEQPQTRTMRLGLFGASTGAAAALVAAAARPAVVAAVVSRGGRPDLARPVLSRVRAPVLLIVGEYDEPVIAMNQEALDHLTGEKELVIVPGATHLFEEPGTLEEVARLASAWFTRYLEAA